MNAIKQNGWAIQFIPKKKYNIYLENKLYLEAIRQQSYVLLCIEEQTNELCLIAVKQNGMVLQYVINQTNEICLEAVKQNGLALQYVKKQTNEICLEAIKQNKNQIKNIECINSEILIYILDNYIFFKNEIDYIKNLITDDLLSDILYYYDFKKIKKILNININEYELIIKCSNIYHII
jgi:hypothetical protein